MHILRYNINKYKNLFCSFITTRSDLFICSMRIYEEKLEHCAIEGLVFQVLFQRGNAAVPCSRVRWHNLISIKYQIFGMVLFLCKIEFYSRFVFLHFYRTQVSRPVRSMGRVLSNKLSYVCKLYWCDSGWWRYKLDTNW